MATINQIIKWAEENGIRGTFAEMNSAYKAAQVVPPSSKRLINQETIELVTVVLTHGNKSKVFRGLPNIRGELTVTLHSLARDNFKGKPFEEIQVALSKEISLYEFGNKGSRGRPKGSKNNPSPTDTPTPQSE